ncbi:MAG: hypothetical protein A2622_08795 [Bdellovibrionales bacterium RIFCSPHIGHO2_01_FULL_40_29]|nr:MAG: hypothetical protein A2622_08795 [Bdellovibrionales bacterium RIFCSPHIGHO2_01_FULL_40_29]OFZ32838.1 MAG: hypothetical protein A3D17_09005 [Bdellovibrionales bacterium RIFCSPHIGHO2_02_FULL_40_15]
MSQKTDKMLKLALVFFISLLSFSIGTFVGKKYSDNQHKLAQLEPQKTTEVATHDFAPNSVDAKTESSEKSDPLLTDSEVAKIAEEFATDDTEMNSSLEKDITVADSEEKDIKEVTVATKATTQAKTPKVASAAAVPSQAKQIQTAIDKIKMEASREVASIPANVGQYTVQVGSFPTQMEAQKLTQELLNKGYKSSFVAAQVNGQTWHRVQVGLFGTVKEAQDYKKDFLEKTKLSAAIVQRVK